MARRTPWFLSESRVWRVAVCVAVWRGVAYDTPPPAIRGRAANEDSPDSNAHQFRS